MDESTKKVYDIMLENKSIYFNLIAAQDPMDVMTLAHEFELDVYCKVHLLEIDFREIFEVIQTRE